jgi:hypothetical protein
VADAGCAIASGSQAHLRRSSTGRGSAGGTRASSLASIAFLALPALLLTACPLGPLAGGRLRGDVQRGEVRDWSFVSDVEQCQLETNPADPHSVNTWCAGKGSALYVPTSMIYGPLSPSERDWVRNVLADPRVRVRVDGVVYERTATRVDAEDEYAAARSLLERKYELDPDALDPAREIWIYRMRPGSGLP